MEACLLSNTVDVQMGHYHHFLHPHVSGQDMIQQGGVQGVVLRVVLGGVGNVLPHQGDGTLQEMGLHAVEVFQEMVLGVLQQKEEKHLQMAQGRIQREEVHMLAGMQPVQGWVLQCNGAEGLDNILLLQDHRVVEQLPAGTFVLVVEEGAVLVVDVVHGLGNTQGVEVYSF